MSENRLTVDGEASFHEDLRELQTTDSAHPETWNPNYRDLLENDHYLRDRVDSADSQISDHEQRVSSIEDAEELGYASIMAEYVVPTIVERPSDATSYAVTEAVSGDNSIDVADSDGIAVGQTYVIRDGSTHETVRIAEVLSGTRVTAEDELDNSYGDSATLSRYDAESGAFYTEEIDLERFRVHLEGAEQATLYRETVSGEWEPAPESGAGYGGYEVQGPVRLRVHVSEGELGRLVILSDAAMTGGSQPFARPPEIISPEDGAGDLSATPTLEGTPFAPLYSVDERDHRQVQVIKQGGDWEDPFIDKQEDADSISVSLDPDEYYQARMRDVLKDGTKSAWSEVVSLATADVYVEAPSIQSPEDGEQDVGEQPVIEGDEFSVVGGEDTHVDTRLRIEYADGNEVYSDTAGEATTTMAVPSDVLDEDMEYTAYLSYQGGEWGWSSEGSVTFHTADSFFPEMAGEQDDEGIGQPVSGGYAVSEREDILGEKYGLVVSGGDGDSWQREADEDGVPGQGGDGQMNWSKDAIVIADHLDDAEDNHGGLDEGVCPNRSDLEDRWGSDWQSHYPSSTDGLFNSEVALAVIKSRVENGSDSWTDHPAWNFLRTLREEELGGHADWYWPAQATGDNFGGDGTEDEVTDVAESEMADIFWRLLQGYAVDLSEGGNPEDDIPERLYKFFYERPDNGEQGSEAFDACSYWSSSEDGSSAYALHFFSGSQSTGSKDSYTFCLRACRRIYL